MRVNEVLSEKVRDAGYETLLLVGGFMVLATHPTLRNLDRIMAWIDESKSRREHLRRLRKRGLVEAVAGKSGWVPRLTELGRLIVAGGRDPEAAWQRRWDGKWRLLTFDLPSREGVARARFRRWMCGNHFGRLQGSVWVTPDPVEELGEVVAGHGFAPTTVMLFEGGLAGKWKPREVAGLAWDFASIDSGYQDYMRFATRALDQLRSKTPSLAQIRKVLGEDRQRWWQAVREDPLLPKPIHPADYAGIKAWKLRGKLLKKLGPLLQSAVSAREPV